MIDREHHKRGHRIVCINNKTREGIENDYLVIGGLYQVSAFRDRQVFARLEPMPHPRDPEMIIMRRIYEAAPCVRLRWIPGCWFDPSWFAPASEYQTVITFYQDLILNPPRNKGDAGSENV